MPFLAHSVNPCRIQRVGNQGDFCHISGLSTSARIASFLINGPTEEGSWDMLIPIDAVRSGMGFDQAGRWHNARAGDIPARRRDDDPMDPARGAILGLVASGAMWIGIIAAARALMHLF